MTLESLNLEPVLGDRAAKYLPRFQVLLDKAGGDPVKTESIRGWNWAAFLLSGYWLIYHRDYLRGAVFLVLILLLPMILGSPGLFLVLMGAIACGSIGDAILFKHVRAMAARRAAIATDAERQAFDRWHSGSSWPLALGAFVALLVISVLADPEMRRELGLGGGFSCSGSEAVSLVVQIAQRQDFNGPLSLRLFGLEPENVAYRVADIRTGSVTGNKTRCAATLLTSLAGGFQALPDNSPAKTPFVENRFAQPIETAITYEVTRTDDGRLYVNVWGL